ncbi:hypothetical protein [Leptotrichia trevisanii]|uniref:hypothetical protein n=1 Tax=Leptotrichia trevisanii TaxID=109328 RepID=UPI0026EA5C75|nr:hypothetical protein [Leptotrichia trevisanii]
MKNTKKLFGIMIAAILLSSQNTQAGWLSNLGERFVNGVTNTVINKAHQKTNKTVNDAMDGKIQKNSNSKIKNSGSKASDLDTKDVKSSKTSSNDYLDTKITTTYERGKAIPYTNKYEQINLGITKFTGERIYDNQMLIGTRKVDIDEFLNPGYYLIWIDSGSRTHAISVVYEHEAEGIGFGYGIVNRKRIYNNGPRNMLGDKEGIMYIVEVLPNTQGHLELTMVNSEQLMGTGTITIFKIPEPTLK